MVGLVVLLFVIFATSYNFDIWNFDLFFDGVFTRLLIFTSLFALSSVILSRIDIVKNGRKSFSDVAFFIPLIVCIAALYFIFWILLHGGSPQ